MQHSPRGTRHGHTVPRACNTAQSGTKPTRRPNSCVRSAGLPTSIRLTTCNSSRARERWAWKCSGIFPESMSPLCRSASMALKASNPKIKIIGVESSDGPAMQQSVAAGRVITLDKIDCIIDGLRVKRVGDHTFSVVQRFVDDIVTLPDREIFDAMIWIMSHC